MKGVLVDSNVILDVFLDDPHWGNWSENALAQYGARTTLYINPIIYSEISVGSRGLPCPISILGRKRQFWVSLSSLATVAATIPTFPLLS